MKLIKTVFIAPHLFLQEENSGQLISSHAVGKVTLDKERKEQQTISYCWLYQWKNTRATSGGRYHV